jgi:hypothetical protein
MDEAWRLPSPRDLALDTLELRDLEYGFDVFMFLGRLTLGLTLSTLRSLDIVDLGIRPIGAFQSLINVVNNHISSLTSLGLLCSDLRELSSTLESTS